MMEFLGSLGSEVPFTAEDLCEGLDFLDPVARRAVVFGLDQGVSCEQVIELTHARAAAMTLAPLAAAAVRESVRHLRLNYVFWVEDGSLVRPLLHLERDVQAAFGGMDWDDLRAAYDRMIWVDNRVDTEHFLQLAKQHGVL